MWIVSCWLVEGEGSGSVGVLFVSVRNGAHSFLAHLRTCTRRRRDFGPRLPAVGLGRVASRALPTTRDRPFFTFIPACLSNNGNFSSNIGRLVAGTLNRCVTRGSGTGGYLNMINDNGHGFGRRCYLATHGCTCRFGIPFLTSCRLHNADRSIRRVCTVLAGH